MNIIYLEGIAHGTNLETWPQEPDEQCKDWPEVKANEKRCGLLAHPDEIGCVCDLLTDLYEHDLAEALSQCIPIAESDQEKIWPLIRKTKHENGYKIIELVPVDFTIYSDTGIELEEVEQYKFKHGTREWFDGKGSLTDGIQREYRTVLRLKPEVKGDTQKTL